MFVAADYPWSPPSPRQTLIGFRGLFLASGPSLAGPVAVVVLGRPVSPMAGLPTILNENDLAPTYDALDVSLWFVLAVHNYLHYVPEDRPTRVRLAASVLEIIASYRPRADARDGLLADSPDGAKHVGLNALWYNALQIASSLNADAGAENAALVVRLSTSFQRTLLAPRRPGCVRGVEHGACPAAASEPKPCWRRRCHSRCSRRAGSKRSSTRSPSACSRRSACGRWIRRIRSTWVRSPAV